MAQKRKRTAPTVGIDPGKLQRERDTKKMDPTARKLLLLSVVLIVLARVMENAQIISHALGNGLAVLSVLALGGFFVVQARSGKGSGL
ncbi:MAG: hypothetical protein IKB79_02530 [Oscillospiraceae bacterium]|nr:hypothetical protein [Oscillospiraceae bacterium]